MAANECRFDVVKDDFNAFQRILNNSKLAIFR